MIMMMMMMIKKDSHNDHDNSSCDKTDMHNNHDHNNDEGDDDNRGYDAYLTRVLLFERKLGDFEGLLDFADFWEFDLWLFGFLEAPWVTVLTEIGLYVGGMLAWEHGGSLHVL